MATTLPQVPPSFTTTSNTSREEGDWASSLNSSLKATQNEIHENTTVDVLHPGLGAGMPTPGPDVPGAYPPTPSDLLNSAAIGSSSKSPEGNSTSAADVAATATAAAAGVVDKVKEYFPTSLTGSKETSLPSTEKSGTQPEEKTDGVGALPGTQSESSVAKLPDERESKFVEQVQTPPSLDVSTPPGLGPSSSVDPITEEAKSTPLPPSTTDIPSVPSSSPPKVDTVTEHARETPLPPSTSHLELQESGNLSPPDNATIGTVDGASTLASTKTIQDAEGVISPPHGSTAKLDDKVDTKVVAQNAESPSTVLADGQHEKNASTTTAATGSSTNSEDRTPKKKRGSKLFAKVKQSVKKVVHPGHSDA